MKESQCTLRMQVLGLRPRFAVLAQREAAERSGGGGAEGGHEGDDDLETAKGIARLFAEIGEAYTALIATGALLTPKTYFINPDPCTASLRPTGPVPSGYAARSSNARIWAAP